MRLTYVLMVPFGLMACAGEKGTDTGGETGDADTDADSDADSDADTDADTVTVSGPTADCVGLSVTLDAATTGTGVDHVRVFQADNGDTPFFSDNQELTGGPTAWTLTIDAGATDSIDGTSTIFKCDDHYNSPGPVMSFLVGAFDATGAQLDCLATGADTANILAGATGTAGGPPDPDFVLADCHE